MIQGASLSISQRAFQQKSKKLFDVVREELRLRNYSHKTAKAYLSCLRKFVEFFRPQHPRELTDEDIRRYLLHLLEHKRQTAGTVNQVYNALRFLYVELYHRPLVMERLPRPQKERKLPDVLNENEALRIFRTISNLKHRTMIMMAYATGVRVAELVRIRIEDLDAERGLIHVRKGKRAKDRYTLLPESLLPILHRYWSKYDLGTSGWLFPGRRPGSHLSERSIQAVIRRVVDAAAISKGVSMHTFRHTFATELLEQGTDIRYIQELLGHESSRTTEIYTHVSAKGLSKIRSPLDHIRDQAELERGDVPPKQLGDSKRSPQKEDNE